MKLSCSGKQNIQELFHLLQKYSFDSANIELRPDFIKESQRKAFKEDLSKYGIKLEQLDFNECEEDSDSDQDLELNTSIMISHKSQTETDVTREIRDRYHVYYYLKSPPDQERLISYCEKNRIGIETNKSIKFTGQQKAIDKLVGHINSIHYGLSNDLKFEYARFLRKSDYVRNLVSKGVKLRVVPQETGNLCNLVVYSNNPETVQDCINEINAVSNNIIKLLELPSNYVEADEMDKVAEYLFAFIEKKCGRTFKENHVNFEFRKEVSRKIGKFSFILFVPTQSDIFTQIKDYILKEMASFCILNVIADKRGGPIPLGETNFSVETVNISKLTDKSILILGKTEQVKEKLNELFEPEKVLNCVYQFKLRLKKLHDKNSGQEISIESLGGNTISVQRQKTSYGYIFTITKGGWKELKDILGHHIKFFKDQNPTTRNRSSSNKTEEEEHKNERAAHLTHMQTKSQKSLLLNEDNKIVSQKEDPKKPLFPIENKNKHPFNLDNVNIDDYIELDKENEEFKKLNQLLKKGYPDVYVQNILKYYIKGLWKDFQHACSKYSSEGLEEYLVFLEDKEDPVALQDAYEHDNRKQFNAYFNPQQHEHCKVQGSVFIAACVVKVEKTKQKVIGSYPAYIIILQ